MSLVEKIELLASGLRLAEAAHKSAEERLGHADADWPTFYANWLILNTKLEMIAK